MQQTPEVDESPSLILNKSNEKEGDSTETAAAQSKEVHPLFDGQGRADLPNDETTDPQTLRNVDSVRESQSINSSLAPDVNVPTAAKDIKVQVWNAAAKTSSLAAC